MLLIVSTCQSQISYILDKVLSVCTLPLLEGVMRVWRGNGPVRLRLVPRIKLVHLQRENYEYLITQYALHSLQICCVWNYNTGITTHL